MLLHEVGLGEDDGFVEGAVVFRGIEGERVGHSAIAQCDTDIGIGDARRGIPQAEGHGTALVKIGRHAVDLLHGGAVDAHGYVGRTTHLLG